MKSSQPALSASTPGGNALAISPVLTSSYVTKPKQSGERPNERRSCRTKNPNFHHRLDPHPQTSPCQPHWPLSTPEKALPAQSPNVIPPPNPSRECSTISRSNKPSVPSSSISSFSLAIRTVSKAISSTCYPYTPTLLLIPLYPWLPQPWL